MQSNVGSIFFCLYASDKHNYMSVMQCRFYDTVLDFI